MAGEFLSDIQGIRSRARQHIERGAVTGGYQGDLDTIIRGRQLFVIICPNRC